MKRMIVLILLSSVLLSGCSLLGERMKEPVTFYYVHSDFQEEMGDVIGYEIREASGHRNDLPYLLALYSMGPSSEELISLIPQSIPILPVERSEGSLVLSLEGEIQNMSDAEYTLACACLAKTCMGMIDVDQVTVTCGNRSITIREDSLLLAGTPNP